MDVPGLDMLKKYRGQIKLTDESCEVKTHHAVNGPDEAALFDFGWWKVNHNHYLYKYERFSEEPEIEDNIDTFENEGGSLSDYDG